MMQVSQKSRYALRALFELARHYGEGPIRIGDIAREQAIPPRFLEGILNQLKQSGLLRSVRGARGGYELARDPGDITVGEMMRITEGPIAPTGCALGQDEDNCPLYPDCAFLPMWRRAGEALSSVYDSTSFADLLAEDRKRQENHSPIYVI
jgi:Rrf2 family transcriptional regulator, cysteine metabolism repressor